ncbi:J domain-containing protein [Pyxidicoccus parkwayensis]
MAGPGTRPTVPPVAPQAGAPNPAARGATAPTPGPFANPAAARGATAPSPGPVANPAAARGPAAPTPGAFANPAAAGAAPAGAMPSAGAAPVAAGAAPTASAAPAAAPAPAVVSADESPFTVPPQGPLDQLSPIRLYGRIAAGEQTGLLSLMLADRVVHIHFRKGNPEFVDSSHAEDALGTSLMGARLLTPEQLQQAESSKERFGGDLLAALFGLGLLQPASAFTQLAQRAVSILSKGLRAESGTFTFEPKDLPGHKAMPLGNRWAVLSDSVRRLPPADLKRRLAPVLQLPIMKSGGLVAASELRLTPHEVRTLAVIDGVRSVAQLLNDFPQDGDHLLRIAFLLRELDGVSFAAPSRSAAVSPPPGASAPPPATAAPQPPPAATAQRPAAPQPPPAAAAQRPAAPQPPPAATAQRPAAPQPAAPRPPPVVGPAAAGAPRPAGAAPAPPAAARPAPPVVNAAAGAAAPARPAPAAPPRPAAPTVAATPANAPGAEEIPALRQLATAMKQQNHFQRLGLTEQTNSSAVKIAYFRLAKLYHPDTLPQGAPQELEKLKAEVFAYIGDAYRTLSDDKSRASYIEELKAGGGAGTEVDVNSILMAEELFQKSCILVKARKFADAVKMLDEAIKLNAEEAEFYAWRGYARFFTAADKKAAQPEAFREIQNAIKRNERCAPAHYFLGVIAKLSGDTTSALKHFKRTVELQPDHIDAQREIRMAAQKK